MDILVNTDRNIDGTAELSARVRSTIESTLGRFSSRITRIEVHLSDENSAAKGGSGDIRCLLEARLNQRPPTAVTANAPSVDEAVIGATEKLERALERTIGRLEDR